MDLKQFLLQRKRFFDEEVKQYQGPDPLRIRCEFISCLENFPKEDVTDIYIPVLEETLKLFMEDPKYKQDIRFIQLWLSYSITQPDPVEVYKNMHSRGLGTECALLYSSWAEQLVKNGMFSSADYVFRMGLTADLKSKNDLQKQYDEFVKEVGQRVLLGKLHCSKCGSVFKCTDEGDKRTESLSSENVMVWEWNPLRPGEKDDFTCPFAYFEEPDSTKIRMYPKEKVYSGDNDEISLEELLALTYELRYQEEAMQQALAESKAREEAKQKSLLEAKAREEEARRLREENNELRKKEAEKFDSINFMAVPPVQASIPVVTPKMMNFPKRQRLSNSPAEVKGGSAVLINNKWPQDNSMVNNTTVTVHTKEALNLVQDMWSSPAPPQIQPRHLFQNESTTDDRAPPVTGPKAIPFEIYSEDDPPPPSHKQQPFHIYDENPLPKTNSRPAAKGKIPFEIYDENAPPGQEIFESSKPVSAQKPNKVPFEIYDENQMKTPNLGLKHMPSGQKENAHSVNRVQLFADDGADLASKLQSQAVIQPMCNVNQDRNDDFSDVTCNTKAFDFVLPSSTPLAFHKQKALNSGQKFEDASTKVGNRTDLSVILEQSKEKCSNSSIDSLATLPKTPKSGTVYQADMNSSGEEIENTNTVFPTTSQYRPSSLYTNNFLDTIEEESILASESSNPSNSNTPRLPLNGTTLRLKQKTINKTFTVEDYEESKHYSFFYNQNTPKTHQKAMIEKENNVAFLSSSRSSLEVPSRKSRKSSIRLHNLLKSPKVVIEKENLSPGMVGFPLSEFIERPNLSIPIRRSSRNKLSILNITEDKENLPSDHNLIYSANIADYSQEWPNKSYNINNTECLKKHFSVEQNSNYSFRISFSNIKHDNSNKCSLLPKSSILETSPIIRGKKSNADYELKVKIPLIKIEDGMKSKSEKENKVIEKINNDSKFSTEKLEESNTHSKNDAYLIPDKEKPVKKRGRPKKTKVSEVITCENSNPIRRSRKIKSLCLSSNNNDKSLYEESTCNAVNKPPLRRSARNKSVRCSELPCIYSNTPAKNENKQVSRNFSNKKRSKHCKKKVEDEVPDSFDPFSSKIIEELLDMIGFPKSQHLQNYHVKQSNLPTGTKTMKLGDETYSIIGEIGKGAYAKVLKATNASGTNTVALKIEKPPCRWEFYIAKEIQCRVPPEYASAFMDITAAHIYNNGSVLETQYAKYGTLINNINLFKEKMGKSLDFGMVLHFAIELVDIVEYLHKCKIIHADMKPDNIVLRELPAHNESEPCLLLIDFGRCIDMSLLPPDIKLNYVFTTEDNKCIEMKENKPWTYQIDLQGLASIFYCLLVSEYMKVQKKNDRWTLQKQLPRNVRRDLWNPIFDSLLNVNPATDLPFNFTPMRESLKEAFESSMNLCLQNVKTFRNLVLTK